MPNQIFCETRRRTSELHDAKQAFLKLTAKYHFRNSMCEYAYENGKAERINGIIKNNYLVFRSINNFQELVKELDRSVSLYNNERPHKSLKYKTPREIEKESILAQEIIEVD